MSDDMFAKSVQRGFEFLKTSGVPGEEISFDVTDGLSEKSIDTQPANRLAHIIDPAGHMGNSFVPALALSMKRATQELGAKLEVTDAKGNSVEVPTERNFSIPQDAKRLTLRFGK